MKKHSVSPCPVPQSNEYMPKQIRHFLKNVKKLR
jgi:hypothetical protein